MSCVEEEIDHMNESFLQLSMQIQRRVQMSAWQKDRESSAGNHEVIVHYTLQISYIYTVQRLNLCGNLI